MAQNFPIKLLTQFNEVAKRVAGGNLSDEAVAAMLQALIEKQPLGASSLGAKVIDSYEGVDITEAFLAQTMTYHGQLLKRHRNGGGWVPAEQDEHDQAKAFVAETAYVGPFAMIYENARIVDNAQISGDARISGDVKLIGGNIVS